MLYQILKKSSERDPEKSALVYGDSVYRYKELLYRVDRMADALEALGYGKGDRIAFFLFNVPEIIMIYFACFKRGVTVVPINYRLKEDEACYIIEHDGSNISPQEVEEVFYHHPAVFEVGVIGVPDRFEGENVHAFVALKEGAAPLTERALLNFAKAHLADYKLPQSITFIASLPKGATGKIDRKLLKAYYLQSKSL